MEKVAVYGTLKRGYYNHRFLGKSEFIGDGITEDKYKMTSNGHFPYLKENGDYNINVEVYSVDLDTLEDLDRLEGHPFFYERKEKEIKVKNEIIKCWIYLCDKEGQIELKNNF